jgi:transcriptional regulator with XRE-family HTH domain
MSQRRHPPNRLLAWERLQRGWSYEEVSERLREEMARTGETDTGLTANTVRRWETGERWPEPRYRKHLVSIFGKPASDLGLLTPDELSLRPDPTMIDELRRALDVIAQAEPNGGVGRDAVLRGLLGLGALPLLAPLLSLDPDGAASTAERVADPDSYATISRCHQRLYWSAPARGLYESAYAHTQLGVGLLRAVEESQRVVLASAVAESALLTARLAFFDLGQTAVADRCFDVALAATREAGDHSLAAAVLGHMAFAPAFGHRPENARSLLQAAFQHTWHGVAPVVRSWLHCVASEVEGRAGDGRAGLHQIDLAATALEQDAPAPPWSDFYDAGRFDSFAGYASLAAGDATAAAVYLTSALEGVGPNGAKQRTVILADLAAAHGHDGDRAAGFLGQAVVSLQTDWYGTGFDRIRAVRPILGDSRHGQNLDHHLAAVEAARMALPQA